MAFGKHFRKAQRTVAVNFVLNVHYIAHRFGKGHLGFYYAAHREKVDAYSAGLLLRKRASAVNNHFKRDVLLVVVENGKRGAHAH